MKIKISKGIGEGPTEAAAFDAALIKAGVANFNLIYLSSVIPPGSEVEINKASTPPQGSWGDRLYVVIAQKRTSRRNQEVWASVGWIQDPKTGKGLLQEHQGNNENEVRADMNNSLQALGKSRGVKFTPPQMEVAGIRCEDRPVCALVVAVFESSRWRSNGTTSNGIGRLQRIAGKIGRSKK